MHKFLHEITKRILIFDGSKGYMLQRYGLKGGECPELWNVTHSNIVKEIYSLYKEAGSDVIQTNTFSGNRVQLEKHGISDRTYELNYEGARIAREVMGEKGFVVGSIGPTGILFEPSGDLTFENAYEIFKEQIKALVDGGVDLINFETFTDVAEMRAGLFAAKETADIPIICSVSFEQNGRTLMGTDPETAVIILKSLGADMVGTNCSFGPELMVDIVKQMHLAGGEYLSVKPNAGLPEIVNGVPVYKESAKKFAALANRFVEYGARLIGGCCGTTPEFIRAIKEEIDNREAINNEETNITNFDITSKIITSKIITSGVKGLDTANITSKNIGELIPKDDEHILNQLADMYSESVADIVMDLALDMASEDFDAIYVNVDKAFSRKYSKAYSKKDSKIISTENAKKNILLAEVINTAQGFAKQPLIIETCSPEALENALRIYKGRAGVIINKGIDGAGNIENINSVIINNLVDVANKYGALIIKENIFC
ncbi:MAG TPA: homocysteine methyltransferase [Clostridiaceae bacterium]|nr:homocysteine methyltransferase [Clostridiaceae bacterium]